MHEMNDACLCSCKCNAIKELNTWGVTLGVWPNGMKSCILCVEHLYDKATACSSQFRLGMGRSRKVGYKTSGVANEIMAVRATEGRK
jgi:hypothetical protein